MTKIFWPLLILSIIAAGLFSACSGDDNASGSSSTVTATATKPVVVATTVQITALTREVGGDKIDLTGIIPAGADAHEFEPTASDLTKIENAQLHPAPRHRPGRLAGRHALRAPGR